MSAVKIAENIYWVGVVDWTVRAFHGHTYNTSKGSTYNAYLIIDDKVTLIDTVYGPFSKELIENIRQVIDPSKIDYVIANHVETDHSGAMPEIMKLCPKAKVYGTAKCKEGLYKHYYGDWDFQIVKTGDKLNIGKKTLTFVEAPMLHWPDSMFTYSIEDQILFPNDAFGQHYASSERFDDEVDNAFLMDEAAKYYANILWPLSSLVERKINDVIKMGIPIKMIAPSHGIIWRTDPMKIVNAYLKWSKNEGNKSVVIVYETMWSATSMLANKIAEGIIDSGVSVKIYDINKADKTEVIKEMMNAGAYLIGSSTHDSSMLPTIAGFLELLRGLKPKKRVASVFGSYGWAGGAVKDIEEILKKTEIELVLPSISFQYMPNGEELKKCYEFGKVFADKVKGTVAAAL